MYLLIELIAIGALVWAFRTVRAQRIVREILESAKRYKPRVETPPVHDAWMKNATKDTRPPRGRYTHDAPSYTAYTEETGRFQRSETGTFRKLS